MNPVTEKLDKIATDLENKGYIKEAMEIDAISNAIDKLAAFRAQSDPMLKNIGFAIKALTMGKPDKAVQFLDFMTQSMDIKNKSWGNVPGIRAAIGEWYIIKEALKKGELEPQEAIDRLKGVVNSFTQAEDIINNLSPTGEVREAPVQQEAEVPAQRVHQPTDMVFRSPKKKGWFGR